MPPRHILLTGFGPFRRVIINPTEQIILHFREQPPENVRLTTHIFPVSFNRVPQELERLLVDEDGDPIAYDAILLLGVATGSSHWRVETQGENADAAFADADNFTPQTLQIIEDAPQHLASTFPSEMIKERIVALGLPVTLSTSAGNYLCNHVLYRALHFIHERTPKVPVGFLHIPAAPDTFAPGITSAPVFSREQHLAAVAETLAVLVE